MSYYVYILTNANHTVLYTGVTNDINRRVHEHASGKGSAFTRLYQAHKLVFWEQFDNPKDAIAAEKRIKAGSRAKKVALVEAQNPFGEILWRMCDSWLLRVQEKKQR